MIRWLIKGIVRDKTRSFFPFLVVTIGVALLVILLGFMDGVFMGMIDTTSSLDTGHLRFVNKAFYDEEFLVPLDRALSAEKETKKWLEKTTNSKVGWAPRIRWNAIMDVPDDEGETLKQTPVMGLSLDMTQGSIDRERLNLKESLLQGEIPSKSHEMLVGYLLAQSLDLNIGQSVTILGQSFDGGLAAANFKVVGILKFGVQAMDKKMAITDLRDAQETFYMEGMVTDWLGYFPKGVSYKEYRHHQTHLQYELEQLMLNPPEEWAKDDRPIVLTVLDQKNIFAIVQKFEKIRSVIIVVFTAIMVLVLWNAGLLNGIHRFGEVGLRLALGETNWHIVGFMVLESFIFGVIGSIFGCLLGGGVVYYLQEVGVDMGDAMAQSGMMLSDVVRGRVSWYGLLYGIIPGMTASVLGNFIANLAVFKRSEASLFRELEAG